MLRDRDHLIRRLSAVRDRLLEVDLSSAVDHEPPAGEWSAHDVLSHIVVLSKYYGVLAHRVAEGTLAEIDLLEGIRLRDSTAAQFRDEAVGALRARAASDHARTLSFLERVQPQALRRRAVVSGIGEMTTEEILRLALITHLEEHVDQLIKELRVIP